MRSLAIRVLALVAGSSLLLALLLALIAFVSYRGWHTELLHARAAAFAQRIVDANPGLWDEYARDAGHFGDTLRQFVLYEPNTGLYLLDRHGRVLASAGEDQEHWNRWRLDLVELRGANETEDTAPRMGPDPDMPEESRIVALHPVVDAGQVHGWLYVVARASAAPWARPLPGSLADNALRAAVKIALTTLAIGVLLTLAVMALLARPLASLTAVVDRVTRSGFADELDSRLYGHAERRDEIGRLARAFRDMFARLRQEMERVTRTDALRREMVASVSHDLRTPLTALIGQLDTVRIKGDALTEAERGRFLELAGQNALHLKRLIDALADLARLDAPELRIEPEPIALGELADDIAQRWQTRAAEAGVTLEAAYPDGLPLVPVDVALIERALGNLLDNALRVTPPGGKVTLAVYRDGHALRLEVADTGPGVPVEDRPHVFDRFFQGSRHRAQRGSAGLGLAIVRRVATLHGGGVGLDDDGQGARFWIRLPLDAPPAVPASEFMPALRAKPNGPPRSTPADTAGAR